ncbi:MAG: ABC transporter permease [Ignavibacteriales bacterium]
MFIKNIYYNLKRYSFLLQQLIARDFKVKYKRSFLGVIWSLLYPLLMMTVMALVFSNVFKFSVPGVNYLVYLMIGLTFFNYFSEASNLAMSSVVANFSLINKIYIPKYIFPLSKILFVGINFLLTLIPLYLVIIFTGSGDTECAITFLHLLLPYAFMCLLLFTIGVSFVLATISVFLRDMFYIYGIVITIWTYLTPIMYDISMIAPKYQFFFKLNPLYQYIDFARTIILESQLPTLSNFIWCGTSALITLFIGLFIFRKYQDKFIYYV